jgi:nicotinamide-nucleotide amidase
VEVLLSNQYPQAEDERRPPPEGNQKTSGGRAFSGELTQVLALADRLRARGWRLATAESCTGGLIAAACTAVAGSSDWFERGFVTYSNEAKTEMLGVPAASIQAHGAVSAEVARAMAEGALAHSRADVAVAVTGIAGPGGGSAAKPVGTVWLALARRGHSASAELLQLPGDRAAVRAATVHHALARLVAEAAGG